MTQPAQKPGRSKQNYATPEDFLDAVRRRLNIMQFAIDLAADGTNHVAPLWIDEAKDSLSVRWFGAWDGWAWLNPPFDDIGPWAARCAEYASEEWNTGQTQRIAFLVPAGVGSNWFRDHVDGKARVLLLNGRLSFDGKAPYPKDCILCLYGVAPGYEVWNWRRPAMRTAA